MSGLYDEDGIDGPWWRRMEAAMREDAKEKAAAMSAADTGTRPACAICDEVGGQLARCAACGMPKKPVGRSVALEAANGHCDHECPGYYADPKPGQLWPGERYGDSLGHMPWHEEVPRG